MWLYQFLFWSFAYVILATAVVAVLIEIEEDIVVLLNFISYPMFIVGLLAICGFVGTYFDDAASKLWFLDIIISSSNILIFNRPVTLTKRSSIVPGPIWP